jgi:two-component system, NtrC family, C4-dicarboxylate transport response regulator DctD
VFDGLKVLLIEDDPAVRAGCEQALQLAGLEVESFHSADQAKNNVVPGFPGIIVSDVRLPGMQGQELLQLAMNTDPGLPVILVTGHGDIAMAVQAMRDGAYDFIEKPFSSDHLVEVVRRALEKRGLLLEVQSLRRLLEHRRGIEASILGRSAQIEQLRRLILELADTSVDVMIYGETGTGKELVARSLHEHSRRRDHKFVALNCAALPETIFESEVFGHEAGSFTGAAKRRIGKLEYADRGTFFLDEIESTPLALQVKLLRALQERQIERLGSNESLPVDVRVIAAAKSDLKDLSDQQKFRPDLYYRLNVAVIELSSLRERREDIPILFEHFVVQAAMRFERPAPIATSEQMHALMTHSWPGNVRELRNVADRFVLGLLSEGLDQAATQASGAMSLSEQTDRFERHLVEEALKKHAGQVAMVSDALGTPRKTLYDKLRKYGLSPDEFR